MEVSTLILDDAKLAAMLSQFAGASVVVSCGDFSADESPYFQERELVANAVASRRAEFFSGRHHARRALHQLNYPAVPILRGEKGNPLWPADVLGAITHDLGQVVVAVMARGTHLGFGIDLVLDLKRIEQSLQPLIALPAEIHLLADYCASLPALALAFSLKESVVKAISPAIDCYLDLLDIELSLEDGEVRAKLAKFNATFRCGFVPVENGLLTFATLGNNA